MNKKRNKHIFSTYVLIGFIFIIFITIFTSATGSSDLDEICNTNNAILKRVSGLWDCSITHYAEAYYHSYSTPLTIATTTQNLYINISGFNISNINGFINNNNYSLITNKTGVYIVDLMMSFDGGNSGEYEVELFVNNIAQPDCSFFRSTSSTASGNAIATCLKTLTSGDEIVAKIKDISAPAQAINIHQLNFKIVEVQ